MNEKKLLAHFQELDKSNNFDQLAKELDTYEKNPKFLALVSYFRGYLYQVGHIYKKDDVTAITYYQKSYDEGHYPLSAYKLSKVFSNGTVRTDDVEKANAYLLESANNGCIEAKNDLAVVYISGRGSIHQNVKKAIELWKECIKQKYILAEINLAYFNINNSNNKKDINNGFEVIKKYSLANVREALYYYALILINGVKVESNEVAGIKVMKKSASLGHLKAILFLADAYYHGHHTEIDHKLALYYYEKAALQRDLDACMVCSYAYLRADGVERNLQKSLDYCYIAAKGGKPEAQIALGDRYYYGDSVKQDYHIALHWYKEATEAGSGYAYARIADMFVDGQGVKKDTKKAFELYNRALELGDKDVYLQLGRMFESGIGTKRNKEKALENYLNGYKNGNPHAAYYYAELVASGKVNGIKDYQNAAPAYIYAADSDIVEACKKTGECYLKSLGVIKDLEKSLDYYLKASLLGDTESTIMVNIIKKQIDLNSI